MTHTDQRTDAIQHAAGTPTRAHRHSCARWHAHRDAERLFLGVFDGHGEEGEACSGFARDVLPPLLAGRLAAGEEVDKAHAGAFAETNARLRADPTVDDASSGTTAVTLTLRGARVTVANVGDSRAILGEAPSPGGQAAARNLSWDQTPYREDELRRVRRAGAVVAPTPVRERCGARTLPSAG